MSLLKAALLPGSSQSELSAWVEWKNGLRFKLGYLSRATATRLQDTCTTYAYSEGPGGRGNRVPKLDPKKFTSGFVETCLKDWNNVSLKSLSNVIPVNTEGRSEEELAAEMPFSVEDASVLLNEAPGLDDFLLSCAMDISIFRSPKEVEIAKNSETSPSGN